MASLSLKRITSIWIIAILLLFIVAIVLGITMRFNQGTDIEISPVDFYSYMTAHAITMIGIWAAAGIVGVHYLLSRYVKVSSSLSTFALGFTVVAIVMLWLATFVGKFHAGWTILYPLPFYIAWEQWATPMFLGGLLVLGASWLVWTIGIMMHILKKYSFSQAFAWQHLSKKEPSVVTPPLILITTVSLVGVIVCLLVAAILLVLLFAEYFSNGGFVNDPLLIKNLTYFFGHTIANESLYLGLAVLYEILPEITGRPKFKMTWYISLAWNVAIFLILGAFFHHLYMDFVQPVGLQIVGQIASYFASLPSVVVTIISIVALIYNHKVKWSLISVLYIIGLAGWMIGGVGAMIDATISNNVILHNTLWVPAHFHTYNAMGNVLFSLAFFLWAANEFAGDKIEQFKRSGLIIGLLLIGGFGFVLMFYWGGAYSVPRRYAFYPDELSRGAIFATAGAWYACIYLLAILILFVDITKKCLKVFSSSH